MAADDTPILFISAHVSLKFIKLLFSFQVLLILSREFFLLYIVIIFVFSIKESKIITLVLYRILVYRNIFRHFIKNQLYI